MWYGFAARATQNTLGVYYRIDTKSITDVQSYGSFEIYEYPGKYTEADDGTTYAGLRMEEQAAKYARAVGRTRARWIGRREAAARPRLCGSVRSPPRFRIW